MLDKEPSRRPTLTDFRTVMNDVRGFVMQTMGAEGSQGFRSQFGPRPVEFGAPRPLFGRRPQRRHRRRHLARVPRSVRRRMNGVVKMPL